MSWPWARSYRLTNPKRVMGCMPADSDGLVRVDHIDWKHNFGSCTLLDFFQNGFSSIFGKDE